MRFTTEMAAKKQPEAMQDLQAATDRLEDRFSHLAHLGAKDQQRARDLVHRAKALLNPEPALILSKEMTALSDELDRVVKIQKQRHVDMDAERQKQLDTVQAIKAEGERRREEARLRRIAMGATAIN